MHFIKPNHLQIGDTVAIVSPSWGGPSIFPHIYDAGLKHLIEDFGLKVKEYPTARKSAAEIYASPECRAKDVNEAFADAETKAIIFSIGGDDSVRILPFLDKALIQNNPKIILGYSDATTLLTSCNQLGLVTYHGPSIMAGFSQLRSLPKSFETHIKTVLFQNPSTYQFPSFEGYAEGYPDWSDPKNVGGVKEMHPGEAWHWLQGSESAQGPLFGGCIEVLDYFLKGTIYWPDLDFFKGKILFLETSEDKPTVSTVKYMLRGLGMLGIFDQISGLIFGRARDYSSEEKLQLDAGILMIVANEFGHKDLPIVTNMDFGHTDPQWILPLGIQAEIDVIARTFRLLESPCAE